MSEETNTTPLSPQTQKIMNSKQLLLGLLLASLVCNFLLIALLFTNKPKEVQREYDFSLPPPPPVVEQNYNDTEQTVTEEYTYLQPVAELYPDPTDYTKYYKNLVEQAGVVWLDKPIKMGDLKLVQNENFAFIYYQIGTINGKPIVFVESPCDGMCNAHMIFVIEGEGKGTLIKNNSTADLDSEWALVTLAPLVSIDLVYKFEALLPEDLISVGDPNIKIQRGGWFGEYLEFFSQTDFNINSVPPSVQPKVEFLKDTSWGPLFRNYFVSEVGTVDYHYAIRLPGGLSVTYDEAAIGFMTDDRVPQITWLDGGVNTEPYRGDRLTGCGGGGPEIVVEPLKEPKIKRVGTTKTGEAVYNVIDPMHPLITRIFEMTSGIVYDYDSVTGMSSSRTITTEEFIAEYGVLLVESLGRQIVLNNTKYGPQVECGKPVIYLYPEATTTVSVSVDALVTKSEPVYEEGGWVATAHPDGSLIVNGQSFTSLYWDGYGNGVYPELKQGFVVSTSEVLDVMSEHLRYIGFNDFEISEFVTFWSDHLPEEQYTRFSWLQTVEMERLAKLTISPKPDTLIRAFVDYEGVDEMIMIEPQKLIKRARNGYVVTEWGGLLRK